MVFRKADPKYQLMHPNPEKGLQHKARRAWWVRKSSQALHWEGCEQCCMQDGPIWESLLHKGGCLQARSPSATPFSPITPGHSIPLLSPEGTQNFACWSLPSVYICSRNNQKLLLVHYFQNLYLIKQENIKQSIQTDVQSKQSCSYFPAAILSGTNFVSQTNNDLKYLSKLLPTPYVSGDWRRTSYFKPLEKHLLHSLKTSGGKDWALTLPL